MPPSPIRDIRLLGAPAAGFCVERSSKAGGGWELLVLTSQWGVAPQLVDVAQGAALGWLDHLK